MIGEFSEMCSPACHRSRSKSLGTARWGTPVGTWGRTSEPLGRGRGLVREGRPVSLRPWPTVGYTAGGTGSSTGHSSTPTAREREGGRDKVKGRKRERWGGGRDKMEGRGEGGGGGERGRGSG